MKYTKKIKHSEGDGDISAAEATSIEYKGKIIPHLKKFGIASIVICAILIAVPVIYVQIKYNIAVDLYESGDYESASEELDIFVYYDKDYGDRTSLCNPTIGHSEKEKGCYQWARRNVSPIDKSKSYWDILFKPKSYWKK